MNEFATPPYGYGYCPHCTLKFHLTQAVPVFFEHVPHNDTLIYLMCQQCSSRFTEIDYADKKSIMNQCFRNVKDTARNPDGNYPAWSVTTTLTLALNGNNYFQALENGHQLSQSEYFSICARNYEVAFLPGGLRIICSDLKGVSSNENK